MGLFCLACVFYNIHASFDLTRYNADFGFYFTPVYDKLILDWNIFPHGDFTDTLYAQHYRLHEDWTPTPFYSYPFLLLLFFPFGKFLFALQGLILGCIAIASLHSIMSRFLNIQPYFSRQVFLTFYLVFVAFSPDIFANLITSGTMGVFMCLVLTALSLTPTKLFFQFLLLAAAVLVRANSILYLISAIAPLVLFGYPKLKEYIVVLALLIFVYLFGYNYFFSGYPGIGTPGGLLFYPAGPLYFRDEFRAQTEALLGFSNPFDHFSSRPEFLLDYLRGFFVSFKQLHLFIVNYYMKISILVGFPRDVHFVGDSSGIQPRFWLVKTFYIAWFWSLIAPGLFVCFRSIFDKKVQKLVRGFSLASITFFALSACYIAATRYSLIIQPFLIFLSMAAWMGKESFHSKSSCVALVK